MKDKVRLLIADDHAAMRDGVKRLLEHQPSIQVIGEIRTVGEVLGKIKDLKPDVMLLDLKWGNSEGAGFRVLEQIRARRLPVRIILHTSHPKLLQNNPKVHLADGIILNVTSGQTLISEILRVADIKHAAQDENKQSFRILLGLASCFLIFLSVFAFLVIQLGVEPLRAVAYLSLVSAAKPWAAELVRGLLTLP